MKNFLSLLLLILLVSCSDKPVQKPDNLLTKDTMENIIYDTSILQAAQGYKTEILSQNNIKINDYIYKKYTIDSTTYFQNYKYYASDIKTFKKIYMRVNSRIENKKNEIDTLLKIKKIDITEDSSKDIPLPN